MGSGATLGEFEKSSILIFYPESAARFSIHHAYKRWSNRAGHLAGSAALLSLFNGLAPVIR
jgi:hypothetical protein